MKRRIAVFANGWGSEYLRDVGQGISKRAEETDTDVFAFVNFSSHSDTTTENVGESNIFNLPDLKNFDGAIFLTNSFNLQSEIDYLQTQVWASKIPAVSLEYEMERAICLESDNYSGMYKLTEHLYEKHNVKRVVYVGGYKEHRENATRLRAVLDASEKAGITIPDENILYGDWSADSGVRCIKGWMKEHDYLPDVIICANDLMALSVCDWLTERGIDVPETVKVTGFDNLQQGQKHSPALTSVSQDWVKMGYSAVQTIHNMIDGIPVQKKVSIETKVYFRESCGCESNLKTEDYKLLLQAAEASKFDGLLTDQHFRHLYMAVRKNKTVDELNRSLNSFFSKEGFMEGKDFILCLHNDFFKAGEDGGEMTQVGYPSEVNVICAVLGSETSASRNMSIKEALFMAAESHRHPGTYICVPLHNEDISYGFGILSRGFSIAGDNLLYIWTRHMRQYLEQVRSNVQIEKLNKMLSDLSVTDILTGTYNRTGCEKILYPAISKWQEEGARSILLIADVDCLKIINDKLGHGKGDQALIVGAEAIRAGVPESFLVARYGGDEFLIVGRNDENLNVEQIRQAVGRELEKLSKIHELDFLLTLSIGGLVLDEGEEFNLVEQLMVADNDMYEIKSVHHAMRAEK